MARKQVPFRLDPEIDKLFEDAVDECGTTKQHVLEVFVESYVKHHREGALIHMNGVPCPLKRFTGGDGRSAHWRSAAADAEAEQSPQGAASSGRSAGTPVGAASLIASDSGQPSEGHRSRCGGDAGQLLDEMTP